MEPAAPLPPNRSPLVRSVVVLLPLLAFVWLARRYGETWLRHLLLYLSTAVWARQLVTNLPLAWTVASRFVSGTEREAALEVTHQLNSKSMTVTLDFLGESCTTPQEAQAARDEIRTLLGRIHETGVNANVSLKLSQLGLLLGEQLASDNLLSILDCAWQHNNRVRIDMEDSPVIEATLRIYHTARKQYGYNNVGVVIQSYLYRSEEDICQLVEEGAWIRLVKGAYAEPPEVAYPIKADTDANFIKLSRMMMSEEARRNGVYPAFATHDQRMIEEIITYARANNIPSSTYEFQMLYGIRRDLQQSLVQRGYQVRIYVPYGTAWYPYFVRRLAERPANLWFFLSNFIRR